MSNVTTKVAVVDAQAILEQCTKLQAQIDAWHASAEYKALHDADAQAY